MNKLLDTYHCDGGFSTTTHMKRNKCNNVSGFTLIEVMLAMAIFAMAGVALVSSSETHFRTLGHLEAKMMSSWVASNQLVEASLDTTWPLKNNKKGKVELAGREWFWIQKVQKTNDQNMSAVTIEVRLKEDEKSAINYLTTYLAKATK